MRNTGGPGALSRRALLRRGMLIGLGGSGIAAIAMACSTARQHPNSQIVNPVKPVTNQPGWVIYSTPGAQMTGKPIGTPGTPTR